MGGGHPEQQRSPQPREEGKGLGEPVQRSRTPSSTSLLLGQSEKSPLERLESVGLLASEWSGASLSTESHLASIIVKRHLCENETVGAQEDPLACWEKQWDVWPALKTNLERFPSYMPPTRLLPAQGPGPGGSEPGV